MTFLSLAIQKVGHGILFFSSRHLRESRNSLQFDVDEIFDRNRFIFNWFYYSNFYMKFYTVEMNAVVKLMSENSFSRYTLFMDLNPPYFLKR
jgi:hypothetical protein